MLYCFLANECVQIQSEKDLEYANKRVSELNKAMIIEMIFDEYLSPDQFKADNELDDINKKMYITRHDPNVYEKVNMESANHFQSGYKEVGKLSQLAFHDDNLIIT